MGSFNAGADDADQSPENGVMAYWVEGASVEQRDAHYQAQRWSHVLQWQIDRLYSARAGATGRWGGVLEAGEYTDETLWAFMQMDAEAHFTLVAARQLLRALQAFDKNHRLPTGLTNAQVRDVRDALEHWDKEGGSDAAKRLANQGADFASHVWTQDGPGVLGEVVPDSVLRQWAVDVYADLLRWDPYDGWPA